ncbi:zonular occludens toxin domain-containing protein [Vibrio cincinnatiensis]
MSCYFVYGTLGAGKGIFLARKMKEYLARGSRVATNVDLFPEFLCPNTTSSISRIPSIFRLDDLTNLGRGCPEEEKTKLGGLFLDEAAIWLNSRTWNEKGRKELIDKLILIRKLGWDIYIAIQDPESTDKQALGALGEHFICCTRLDHFRIPIISPLFDFYRLVKSKGREQHSKILPHINRASYRRGISKQGNKPYYSETYRPKDYFGTYDTNQIFELDNEFIDGRLVDMRASFSYLPGKTLRHWYVPEPEIKSKTVRKKFPLLSFFAFLLFSSFAVFAWSMALSSSDKDQVSQDVVTTVKSSTNDSKVIKVPDYLQGARITGHVLWKKSDGTFTYDYAIHDRFNRSLDVTFYGVTLTPVAPCLAWLTTIDNITVQLSCSLPPVQSSAQTEPVLANFNLTDMAKSTIDVF